MSAVTFKKIALENKIEKSQALVESKYLEQTNYTIGTPIVSYTEMDY